MTGRIAVGVDGSPCGLAALRWAAREARLRGDELLAVHAWQLPTSGSSLGSLLSARAQDGLQEAARTLLRHALDEVGVQGVTVSADVVAGDPGQVLVRRSVGADLLVVGSCGANPLAGLLLGSVAQHCTRHARCPVVVVPNLQAPARVRSIA